MTNEKAMRESPVWKLILKMSMPVLVVMMMTTIYSMADIFFMGKTGDLNQVAAVSLASPVFSVVSGLGTLIGAGAVTAISISLGKGELDMVKKYSSFSFWASVALGIVTGALILVFMDRIVSVLGADADTAAYTAEYLRVLGLGAPIMIVNSVMSNTARSDGSVMPVMIVTVVGNLVNIVFDPLFILAFNWGPTGAAAATVLGNLVSIIGIMAIILRKKTMSISIKHFTLRSSISLRVLSLGLPMAVGIVLQCFSGTFSNRLLVKYGNVAVAASGVAGKAGMIVCMIVMGICMGVQPAISYVYGTGDKKRLRSIVKGVGITSVITATLLGICLIIFRDAFINAFIDDASILETGRLMLIGSLVAMPTYGIYQLCSTYLQAIGKVTSATVVSLLRQGLVLIPVLYIMELAFGLYGLAFTGAVADVISTTVAAVLSLRVGKKDKTKISNPAVESKAA